MLISFFLIFSVILSHSLVEAKLVEYDLIVRSIPSNPDGYPRSVIIIHHANSSWDIDRPFPGPLIQANLGDRLRIRITNLLRDQPTAIHFHGLHMFKNPWADGTEYVTQCPIDPHQSFIQEFEVTQTGTFWYHSHNGQQYADGLVGPMIFSKDPIEEKYHYGRNDYVLMLQEWYHESWPDLMTAYLGPHGAYRGSVAIYPWPPTSFLINGHGRFDCRVHNCTSNDTWKDECGNFWPVQCVPLRSPFFGPCQKNLHPFDRFYCPPGEQIRLRLINAASGIPFRFWIEQHNMTIVARDSLEILPINVSHLHIVIGQRLDLIVQCNANPSKDYKIFVASRNSFKPAHLITGPTPTMWTEAVLTYSAGKTSQQPSTSVTTREQLDRMIDLNPDDPFFEYKYLKPTEPRLAPPAIERVTLSFKVHWNRRIGVDALEEWAINNITYEPSTEPLLQGNYLDGNHRSILADEHPGRVNNTHATHIQAFEWGQTYEVLMINDDEQQHPWHLHGYSVDFIQAGKLPHIPPPTCSPTRQQQRTNVLSLESILPPLNSTPTVLAVGDSFNTPRESYALFRFTAKNPGPWFLHCHMDWHISPGLAMVFSVGRNQSYGDLIDPPPDYFPRCGPRQKLLKNPSSPAVTASTTVRIIISSECPGLKSASHRLLCLTSFFYWLKLLFF